MRRSTRSSSGRPMSPDAEQLQEHQEKHTRSRKPSGQPVHPDIELFQGSEERATRSRKPSEDLVVLELPRITRTGRRSGSGKSPDPPKSSARGGKSGESGQRHDKRGLSPAEEPAGETSTKRRRRSGRLAEGDGEKDKQEVQENDEEDASDIKEKAPEKKGKSPRLKKQDVNLKEKGVKDGDSKEKEDKDVKAKKDKNKDPKEQKNVEDSTASTKEPSGTSSRRRTRSGRQGTDGDEESNTLSLPQVLQDSKPDHPKKATEDIHTEEPASKHQKSKDHGRSSSKIGQDKEKRDTSKLRSPPRSPEKSKKVETAKVELPKISLDLGELTVKTSSKPSPRGALSPPLRMSPRRARQPSGQKSCDDSESTESKNTQDKISSEEIAPSTSPGHQAQGQPDVPEKDKIKDKPDKTKKSASACRDISKEFDDSKEKTHSPKKSFRSKKEEDILSQKEEYMCNDQEKSSPSKSHKKSRNHTKSPRESPASSPRKGLRSGKAPEADGTLDPNMAQELDQVNVTMEISSVPPPLTTDACTSQEIGTEKENDSQEVNHAPIASQLLATEKQTKESDNVKEISDEVAAKIREWRVQEEESVGFQGEEWYAEEVDEGEPFYYESDHMALKGNKDYRMLLRTITTLEAQRKQAVKDLDKLVTAQREALRNPLKFVHKLQKKDSLHLPSPQRIVLLPEIPWGRYLGHADSKELIQGLSQTQTRASLKQKDSTEDSGAGPSSSSGPKEDQTLEDDEKMKSVIRGRLWDESKPDTFNRLWTVGEQKRLEDLLLKYPSEEVEARRWEKIAKDLGNRTRHQVASRVQKYFIKLGKAGLPIPGRMPNMATYTNKKPSQRRFINPYNRLTLAPSTFLQSLRAPVLMNEDDALDYDLDYDADSIMEEDDIPSELKDSEEYKELVRLKKLRNATLKQQTDMSHVGYSCDGCGVSPIVGVRWHCVNCPMDISTDLCQNCVNDDFQSDIHSSSHRMDPVHIGQSGGFVDSDYTSFTGTSGDYNYLDPNYSPAVL